MEEREAGISIGGGRQRAAGALRRSPAFLVGATAALLLVTSAGNEQLDADGAKAKSNPDLGAVVPEYQDFQNRIMADAPIAPILTPKLDFFHSKRVPDFQAHPVWNFDLASVVVKG